MPVGLLPLPSLPVTVTVLPPEERAPLLFNRTPTLLAPEPPPPVPVTLTEPPLPAVIEPAILTPKLKVPAPPPPPVPIRVTSPPAEVMVTKQVLADPAGLGADVKVWARLKDGEEGYGLNFAQTKPMDQNFTYGAVHEGDQVQVIVAYTSDGRVKHYDLLILDDNRHVFPPYDALILVSQKAAKNKKLMDALQELSGKISEEQMRQANLDVDVNNLRIRDAAKKLQATLK